MKRNILLVFLIMTVWQLSATWSEITENSGKELFDHTSFGKEVIEVEFSLDGYQMEEITQDGLLYHKISYWNEGDYIQVGKPDLPTFTRMIAIPNQGTPTLEIVSYDEEIVSDIVIYPLQDLAIESQSPKNEFSIDEVYYRNGDIFPAEISNVGTPAVLRGIRVVSVTINPFRYDPVKQELSILKNVNVVVNTTGSGGENTLRREMKLSRAFEPLYRSAILNYESTLSRDNVYQEPSYLFIHPNGVNLEANLAYLTQWKHEKGFEVSTHGVNSGTSFNVIKAYIQDAYDNWENPPEFVCLVGDTDGNYVIPTSYITYYNAGGDHPYAQLEGDDVLEDVFLGRISISSQSDLQTYIVKILNYEKEPYMTETDWYNSALLVGDPSVSGLSTIYTNQAILETMLQYAPNISATEIYSGSYSSLMSQNLNSGVSYFNYRGYLEMSGFGNSEINSLTNFKKFPFAVILTCNTGNFYSGTSQSEAFIRAGTVTNPTGAIAAIGTATIGTHTNFNNCIDAGIFYGIFADEIYNPGGAVNRGKLALFEHYPQNPDGNVDNFTHMNSLMGDPGVELWTAIPQNMVASYENDLAVGTNNLLVTVEDDFGAPLENAWVTALMGDDEIFVTGYTNEDGEIILEIDAQTAGSATLTVTKHNYIPHLGSFDVGEVDRFVNVFEYTIDDDNVGDSSGNDDGIVNPGETIELSVKLKNFGSMNVDGVEAAISTEGNFITITDDIETYGSIAPGTSVFCNEDYDFSVDASTLGGTELRLDVTIEDDAGNTWNDYVFIIIEGANLDAIDYTVDDANGYLDPGETAEISVTIQNNGLVTSNAVYGVLYSPDNRITVSDSAGYFGTITGEDGQASNTSDTFEISADPELITGTQILMEINLYNEDGYDSTVQFLMGIGEVSITDPVGPDAYGYFCYDDEDIDYLNAPVYDWIEINTIGTNMDLTDPGDEGDIYTITDLPITFRMYGEIYDSATICSNGWIAPGGSTQSSFMNSPIPGPQGPSPMIAPFWDDLRTAGGDVYWHYDSSLRILIIEWDQMLNDHNNDEETFQAILYDANFYPTASGDSEIKFQYKIINNTNPGSYPSQHGQYATVGIEDHTGFRGLEYSFNNSYPAAAKHLQNEMALKLIGPLIQLEAPVLVLGGITIIDANGNGQADFGEDVSLTIPLNNVGENPATDISATISSTDPYITINQDTSLYGTIQGSGSASNQNNFEFSVAEDCPDGHNANIEMNIISNENSWTINFFIELNAPNVNFELLFVDDGENGFLDPGETADIYVYFLNSGGADATNILTTLSESDQYITLNSTNYTFSILSAGYMSTGIFNITASSTAPVGHLATINWTMSGNTNFSVDGAFDLAISPVPILLNEDFSGTAYPPNGWTLSGVDINDWSQASTSNAGGNSPESRFYAFAPHYTGESRLVSPVINTTGSASLDFEFRHFVNDFGGDPYTIGVRTTSDGGNSWNVAWEIFSSGAVGPVLQQLTVATPDVGSDNFQIAFVLDGYTGNIYQWFIDDVHLEGVQANISGFINGEVTLEDGTGNVEDVIITAGNFATSPDPAGFYLIPLPAGNYDLTAELAGYNSDFEDNVNVIVGETTTVDFSLSLLEAPQNLVAAVSTNDVTLEWEMLTDTTRSLTGFKVYRNDFVIEEITNAATMTYVDEFLNAGIYTYFVTAVYDNIHESAPSNEAIIETTETNNIIIQAATTLLGNYPNPFNPFTEISFTLKDAQEVTLEIFNIRGQKVKTLVNTSMDAGLHQVVWQGLDDTGNHISSGIYFYKMRAGKYTDIRKMIMMK